MSNVNKGSFQRAVENEIQNLYAGVFEDQMGSTIIWDSSGPVDHRPLVAYPVPPYVSVGDLVLQWENGRKLLKVDLWDSDGGAIEYFDREQVKELVEFMQTWLGEDD